jgi:hypothetical protein
MRIINLILCLLILNSCGSKGGGTVASSTVTTPSSTQTDSDYYPKCTDEKDSSILFHAKGRLNGSNYYLICTAAELAAINTNEDTLGYSYSMGQDINLYDYYTDTYFNNPQNMFMIGSYPDRPFTGTFTSNGYSIINFRYINSTESYCGLFGYTKNATIQKVELADTRIDSTFGFCGSLVGYAESTYLNEVYSFTYSTSLLSSSQWNYVSGPNVAGLIGYMNASQLLDSYSLSTLTAVDLNSESKIAGLAGVMINNSKIVNSFYDGTIAPTLNTQSAGITIYSPILVDYQGNAVANPGVDLLQHVAFSTNKGVTISCYDQTDCLLPAEITTVSNTDNSYFKSNANSPLSLFNQSSWVFSTNYPQLK